MKITRLYVHPIKALRGIELQHADVGPQGIRHDRRFMLFQVRENGELKKMQLSEVPECALFEQQIVGDESVVVRFHRPDTSPRPADAVPQTPLTVPLQPDTASLEPIEIDLHGSPARVCKMGDECDTWFSACFGFPVTLVYIGDGKRPVLGSSMSPQPAQPQRGWLSGITSYLTGGAKDEPWLTFTDVAPLMISTESSLREVQSRISSAPEAVAMYKFRPNIVVDGEDSWAEDFWDELTVGGGAQHRLVLTGNCLRCTSLNVDYETGRPADGEVGTVLKKLMKDRRLDRGNKWSPIFGRYAFLPPGSAEEGFGVAVGDEVEVTRRREERSVWDWPGL